MFDNHSTIESPFFGILDDMSSFVFFYNIYYIEHVLTCVDNNKELSLLSHFITNI